MREGIGTMKNRWESSDVTNGRSGDCIATGLLGSINR
jgi:hypothetical protein